jgi:glycosyltransferase involved in cell wall biosynthesis
MRVLHITNWYPNITAPGDAPFIKRHVESLAPHCENDVWHVAVRSGDRPATIKDGLVADRTLLRVIKERRWLLIEWHTTWLLLWMWWTRDRTKKYDLINIHIAYPLAIRATLLRRITGLPLVITEHWSAYHFSFFSRSKGLDRIRRIFGHDIPLITVSNALADDIEGFARKGRLPIAVVDNVVDTSLFRPEPGAVPEPGRFFAIASWNPLKRSDVLIAAIAQLRAQGVPATLRMAGGGKDLDAMRKAISDAHMEEHISLLGHLPSEEVAREMRQAHALLHSSDYETYSVVCAESLCCGTPIIVSDLAAVKEYLEPDMGLTVPKNECGAWTVAIKTFWDQALGANRPGIAARASGRMDIRVVGARYHDVLTGILANKGRMPSEFQRA